MTKKIYRTAMGKMVDLGAIQLQNENVRAVGNMKVNARGDLVDHTNNPVVRRNTQVAKQYSRQITNVSDEPVGTGRHHVQAKTGKVQPVTEPVVETASVEPAAPATVASEHSNEGGLAAAIAKARQVKQELAKTPRQQIQDTPGVVKI